MASSFDTARLTRRAILVLSVILLALACNDGDDVIAPIPTAPTPEPSRPLTIFANIGSRDQTVSVSRGGRSVEDAIITLNGLPVPRAEGNPYYRVSRAIPAGTPVVLEVVSGGDTVKANGIMPEAPLVTAPERTVFSLSDSIPVAWTSSTDTEGFEVVFVSEFYPGSEVPGTARELTMPASQVGVGNAVILVSTIGVGVLTGPADPASSMRLRSVGSPEIPIRIDRDAASIVASVSIHPSEFGLVLGRAAPLTVAVLDGEGREIPDAVVRFTSDAEQSVTVDASGVVTGVSLGRARITATWEGVSATADAIVTSFIPVEIHLDRTTIPVGDRVQVTATQIDQVGGVICQTPPWGNCQDAGHESISVWSSDRNVATVSREHVVTGVGRGNATIYARLDNELAGWIPESWAWAVVTVE